MAVLSILRSGLRATNVKPCTLLSSGLVVRHSGAHKRVMLVQPSRFQWNKFKDAVHFYIFLGVIPLTVLTFLVSVFVGPAQLAEIPEGYEPEPWEYYKHPIQRWFARYIYATYQQNYEKHMHVLKEEWDKQQLRILESKVRELMARRGDYQAWYYRPVTSKYIRRYRRETDELDEHTGRR